MHVKYISSIFLHKTIQVRWTIPSFLLRHLSLILSERERKVRELKFEFAFNLTEKVYKEKRKEKEVDIILLFGVAKYQFHSMDVDT